MSRLESGLKFRGGSEGIFPLPRAVFALEVIRENKGVAAAVEWRTARGGFGVGGVVWPRS
jgi:hypothetical protein